MMWTRTTSLMAALAIFSLGASASAQFEPWQTYADTRSTSVCALVNAENAELVVSRTTGQLILVTGPDVTLVDTFVDEDNFVYFEGDPVGVIDFYTDADGFRTLWWTTLNGRVVSVDSFTGEPSDTNRTPANYDDVPCDACDFWDDRSLCDTEPPIVNICGVGVPIVTTMSLMSLAVPRFVVRRRSRFSTGVGVRPIGNIEQFSKSCGVIPSTGTALSKARPRGLKPAARHAKTRNALVR